MSTEAHIDPTCAFFNDFKALPRDTPTEMPAPYPDKHPHAERGRFGG